MTASFFRHAEATLMVSSNSIAFRSLDILNQLKEIIPPGGRVGVISAWVRGGESGIEWVRANSRFGIVVDSDDSSSWWAILPDGTSRSGLLYENGQMISLSDLLDELFQWKNIEDD